MKMFVDHKLLCTYWLSESDLNSVNNHFIIWVLYTIHEHSEYEDWTKQVTKICTENLSNMLFAFIFLAINNLDFKKQRNPLKLHRAEQYVFLVGPYGFFRPCRGPFLESPKNVSGPKSHLWNS